MRLFAKGLRLFNSLAAISILVLLAMVLTTITGSASTARDLHPQEHGLVLIPPVSPVTDNTTVESRQLPD